MERTSTPRIILASASPRRRELFGLLGVPFEIEPSRYEEPSGLTEPVDLAEYVQSLALEKAREVAGRFPDAWVIGADTEVSLDTVGTPLGKPTDVEDAKRMMRLLSGRRHLVCTGVALLRPDAVPILHTEATWVYFRTLSEQRISDYVATGEPMDKAGAYGAQGFAAPFIARFEGDFFNVVGLPLCALGTLLEAAGLDWGALRVPNKAQR